MIAGIDLSGFTEDELRVMLTPRLTNYVPHVPTEQQTLALVAHRFLPPDQPSEVFYGGAAGGGKSDWLLMGALEYVDVPGYAAIIFRRTYTELSLAGAIMDRAREWLANTDARWNEQTKTWTFPSSATLSFAYLAHSSDRYRYQSAEFNFCGFDELTQFGDETDYTYLFSRLRRPAEGPLSAVPLRMRAASNPGGVGHGWVKKRFPIEGGPRGRRVFIPAKLDDNPHVDGNAYRASLGELGETLRQQLLDGDWGAFEGAAFTVTDAHVLEAFEIPEAFDRFESMDYGLNNPTAWLAWAVDTEGSLIVFDEFYEPGLPSETAPVILKLRQSWRSTSCVGDPNSLAMRTGGVREYGEAATVGTLFEDCGIWIQRGNDNPRAGYAQLREYLRVDEDRRFPMWHPRAGETGAPRMFVVGAACPHLLEQLRTAPLQPIDKRHGGEMIDPVWESRRGHSLASARYGVLSRPDASEDAVQDGFEKPEDMRAVRLREMAEAERVEDEEFEWGYA